MVCSSLEEQHGQGSGGCGAGQWEQEAEMEGRGTHLTAEEPQQKTLASL